MLVVLAAELAARALIGPGIAVPDYWEDAAGEKFEWYRTQRDAPELLIIGDSTAARNFAPAAIEETLPERDAFNLGTPGNFPLALRDTAYAMLERKSVPEVVVLSQVTHTFYDSDYVSSREALIRGSRAARYLSGRRNPTDYVALARAYDHRTRIVRRLLGKTPAEPSPPYKGFMPDRRPPAPRRVPDRHIDDMQPSAERLDSVIQLAKLATERDFKLIVSLPIQLDIPAQARVDRHLRWLLEHSDRFSFGVLDMRSVIPLEHEYFTDTFHLSPAGARRQSRALGEILRICLAEDDWRECLSDRPPYQFDLVSDPGWFSPHPK